MQQYSTEQIEQDRKSDTDATLKHLVNFEMKHSLLMPNHISHNFINKLSLCAELGLMSTEQRFSEAAVEPDSLIAVESCSLTTPAVLLCCTLKCSLNHQKVVTDGRAQSRPKQSRSRTKAQSVSQSVSEIQFSQSVDPVQVLSASM